MTHHWNRHRPETGSKRADGGVPVRVQRRALRCERACTGEEADTMRFMIFVHREKVFIECR